MDHSHHPMRHSYPPALALCPDGGYELELVRFFNTSAFGPSISYFRRFLTHNTLLWALSFTSLLMTILGALVFFRMG